MLKQQFIEYNSYKWEILSKLILKVVRITFLMPWSILKTLIKGLIKIDKKSYKNIGICNIGYITIKKISTDGYEKVLAKFRKPWAWN